MGLFGRTDYDSVYESDEQSSVRLAADRLVALGQDLPFVPVRPYEHRRLQLGWRAIVLMLLIVAAFYGSLGSEGLWQDERVLRDVALRSGSGIGAIWAKPFDQTTGPAVRTVNWLLGRTVGLGAVQFRLLSIALHAVTAIMLWFCLRRLNVRGAWLAAAVLAIHPATLPTVGWVSRQADILAAACSVMAVWAYLRGRDIRPQLDEAIWTDPNYHHDEEAALPRWPWVLFGLAMLVTLFSGSVASLVAPLALLAIEFRREGRSSKWLRIVLISAAVLATVSAWWFARFPMTGKCEAAIAAGASAVYSVVPMDLPFIRDRVQWPMSWTIATVAVAMSLLSVAIIRGRSLWGLTIFIGLLLASVNGLFARTVLPAAIVSADMVAYPALVVLVPAFVATVLYLLARPIGKRWGLATRWLIGIVLIGGLGSLTATRSQAYATADGVWQHTLAIDPNAVAAREELANQYLAEGFVAEAATQLDLVPEHWRDTHWLLIRGRAFEAQKNYVEAALCYEAAHRSEPNDNTILVSLAEARSNAGQADQAAALYSEAIEKVTNDAGLYTNSGLAQLRLGNRQLAAELYEQALRVDPRYLPAHINLANVLFDLGKFEQSAGHLQEAVRIDPRNFAAFMNAGILLYRLRDFSKAERMFRAAINLDPSSPDAFDDLGIVLAAQGKFGDAAWSFTQATRLNPDHVAAEHLRDARAQLRAQAASQPAIRRPDTTGR